MDTCIDEIADGIFRLSTFVADIGPTGFTFNQFLIRDDESLLFHTGPRAMFPLVSAAIETLTPVEGLRWITFGHVEADECGAMNLFLGCMVSLNDLADRPPVPLADGERLALGAHAVTHIDTPHVPHAWEARVLYEQTTRTLFCGDLGTQLGNPAALTTDDIVDAAGTAEDLFRATCLTPQTAPTIRKIAALAPATLAIMHGSSFSGDSETALHALADDYDTRLRAAAVA